MVVDQLFGTVAQEIGLAELRHEDSASVIMASRRYLAYQNMHCPLQVPSSYEVSPSVIENEHARLEDAMAHALDDGVGNVTALLKSRGMWDDTIFFFSVRCSVSYDLVSIVRPMLATTESGLRCALQSDNGGPVHDPAGGCPGQSSSNNFPLRGMEVSQISL